MAVRADFQCRAASWHSDEDNDVLVSHRITQQTHSRRAGVGRLGRGAPNAPVGHKQSKGLAFSVPIVLRGAPAQCRKDKMKPDTHISNVHKGSIYTVKGAVASIKPHGWEK